MFNYTVITRREEYLKVVALDSDYRKVDEFSESWPTKAEIREGRIASFLFPARITLSRGTSSFINFYLEWTPNFNWLILNLLLILGQLFIIRKTGLKVRKNVIDLVIIGVTGIYGFMAVNFFQNKFFD